MVNPEQQKQPAPPMNRFTPLSAHAAVTALLAMYDGICAEHTITIATLASQLERTQAQLKKEIEEHQATKDKLATYDLPPAKEKPTEQDPLA